MAVVLMAPFITAIYACSSDNDDSGSGSIVTAETENNGGDVNSEGKPMPNPGVFGSEHKHLMAVGEGDLRYHLFFGYKPSGGIDTISNLVVVDKFSEDQKFIESVEIEKSWRNTKSVLTYNKLGYISSIKTLYEDVEWEGEEEFVEYTYDEAGHIKDNRYKWVNDTLTDIINPLTSESVCHFEYGGGKYKNEYQQYDYYQSLWIFVDEHYLLLTGYMGKGSKYFPTKITRKTISRYKDGTIQYHSTTVSTFSYEMNADGTLKKEKIIEKVTNELAKEKGYRDYEWTNEVSYRYKYE